MDSDERRKERDEELREELLQETQELTQALTQELTQELIEDLTELNEGDVSEETDKNWDVYIIIQGHGEIVLKGGNVELIGKERQPTLNILRFAPPGCTNCGNEAARFHFRDNFIKEIKDSTTNILEDKKNLINIFLLGSSVRNDVLYILENNIQDIDDYLTTRYSPQEIPAKKQSIINRLDLINNKLFIKYTPNVTRYAEKKITISTHARGLLTGAEVKIYLINKSTKQLINVNYTMQHTSKTRQEVLFSDLVKIAESKGSELNGRNPYNIHIIDTTCSVFKEDGIKVSPELCNQLQRDISNFFTCEVSQECGTTVYGGKLKKLTKKKRITKRRKKRVKITKRRTTKSKRRTTKSKSKRRN
jgi:hypothetical protein